MYKLVVFDMDGTIIDTDILVVEGFWRTIKHFRPGYIPHLTELLSYSGPALMDSMRKSVPDTDPEEACKYFQKITMPMYHLNVTVYDGLIEVLKSLKEKGVKIALNTNKSHSFAVKALQIFGLDPYFDCVMAGGDCPSPKPSGDGANRTMESLGIKSKDEVLYIGDTSVDYLTAIDARVDCMIVTWVPRSLPPSMKPTYLLPSYKKFFEVLYGKI